MTAEELGPQVIEPDPPPQRQKRRSGPSPIIPYPSLQPTQSLPTSADPQYTAYLEHLRNTDISAETSRRIGAQDLRAEPSPSVPMQYAMQAQQQPMDPSSRIPTPPTGASQGYYHEQSSLLLQSPSPGTVQGGGSPQQFFQASNSFSNLNSHSVQQNGTQYQPPATVQGGVSSQSFNPASSGYFNPDGHSAQLNGAPFRPQTPAFTPYQPDINDQNGMDLSHPAAINQQMLSKQMGPIYSPTQNPMYSYTPAAAPSMNFDAQMVPQNCECGPNCNCLYCIQHPFNRATSERVQDLTEILARDNYGDEQSLDPSLSQPQYETEDALTNGTHMEPATDSTDVDWFTSNPLGNITIPKQTFDEGGSGNDSDQSNTLASPPMKKQDYFTLQYHLLCKCTNTTGTCLCRNGCACLGCCTHRGHVDTPDMSKLPML